MELRSMLPSNPQHLTFIEMCCCGTLSKKKKKKKNLPKLPWIEATNATYRMTDESGDEHCFKPTTAEHLEDMSHIPLALLMVYCYFSYQACSECNKTKDDDNKQCCLLVFFPI